MIDVLNYYIVITLPGGANKIVCHDEKLNEIRLFDSEEELNRVELPLEEAREVAMRLEKQYHAERLQLVPIR